MRPPMNFPLSGKAPGGDAPFSPSDLIGASDTGAYWRSEEQYFFDDTAGATPISASGQDIGSWKSVDGNYLLSNSTLSTQPPAIYSVTPGYVEFAGADYLSLPPAGTFNFSEISIHVLASLRTGSDGIVISLPDQPTTNNSPFSRFHLYDTTTSSGFSGRINGTSVGAVSTGVPGDNVLFPFGLQSDGGQWINGTKTATGVTGPITYPNGDVTMRVGTTNNFEGGYNGRISEILIVDRELTDEEVEQLHAYWAALIA